MIKQRHQRCDNIIMLFRESESNRIGNREVRNMGKATAPLMGLSLFFAERQGFEPWIQLPV